LHIKGSKVETWPVGVELSRAASSMTLHLFGGLFFIGRVLHAYGVYAKSAFSVLTGVAINYLLMVIMSVWAIWFHFVH
jgi:uncharacterized membrane protein YecN with MAPEG domain